MEDRVSLEGYTFNLCCSSCRKKRPKTEMVCNVLSNKIEITRSIHKGLYFLPYKNHHESLLASEIFVFCLTMTQTRLIYYSQLCSGCIGLGLFALLSIARFLSTLRLFVTFSFIKRAKTSSSQQFSCKKLATRVLLCSGWAEIEGVEWVHVGRDSLGSRSRLGRSFFVKATRSCLVSDMFDCLRIFVTSTRLILQIRK